MTTPAPQAAPRTPTANTPGASPSPGNQAANPTVSYTMSQKDATLAQAANSTSAFYRWILAYTVIIVVLVVLNKTRVGHILIYYALALLLLLQLVINYQWFAQALSPITNIGKGK